MFALIIAGSSLAGGAFGWYGHKASLRIEAWGENMNEREGIFPALSKPLHNGDFDRNKKAARDGASFVPPIGNPHLPVGAALSK